MATSDYLKQFRDKGYSAKADSPKKESGMDSGESNSTPRIIKLSDDEQKAFAASHPGEDLACEVHGSLEKDGHFHVMTVGPLGGAEAPEGEQQMASQVAQRVMPNMPM